MANTNKDKQCYCLSLLVLAIVFSDVLQCVLYNIVYPCWFWLWYFLTFFDVFCITLFVLVGVGTIPWPNPTRTNNVIQNTSKNVRQYNGQNQQGQTMLYKTLQRKQQIEQHELHSVLFCFDCLSLLALAMVLSDVLRCALYNIVCPCWVWLWYFLTFFDVFCIMCFV
jgi:hypothetical protein